ncbi:hypothetical protein EJB05_13923 [Eragrostis curvula]|uniref:Uncharacterized protein n=1 Tax=Eragrostis curvula TaxID=38414 RepID=A0A5J9VWZ3_9POAL|nr:hypothetical protein EJB05_13923 [Eragrostis curvula]
MGLDQRTISPGSQDRRNQETNQDGAAVTARVAAADHFFSPFAPMLSPIINSICKTVACGKGNCTVEQGTVLGYSLQVRVRPGLDADAHRLPVLSEKLACGFSPWCEVLCKTCQRILNQQEDEEHGANNSESPILQFTLEYLKSYLSDSDGSPRKFNGSKHQNYVILPKNVIAASPVINSTVISSKNRHL